MNLNFPGSVADQQMDIRSFVDVQVNDRNEPFNAVSLYVPSRFAASNIVDWSEYEGELSAGSPVVIQVDVTNYAEIMQGAMLDQWTAAFRQDTNRDLLIFLIVFKDDEEAWTIGGSAITYGPLTTAFDKYWFLSYVKILFDPLMSGEPSTVPVPGTYTTGTMTISNASGGALTLDAGTYSFSTANKTYVFTVTEGMAGEIANSASADPVTVTATTVGPDAALSEGTIAVLDFDPALESDMADFTYTLSAKVSGTAASTTQVNSEYFDFSLALAYQCRLKQSMSYFYSQVNVDLSRTGFPGDGSTPDTNVCLIASAPIEEETEFLTALDVSPEGEITDPRSQYYWQALRLIQAANTLLIVHSAPGVSVISEMLGAWMASRNDAGTFVGNKMSMLKLSGPNIKPFGYASDLDSEVNVNYLEGQNLLYSKQVGFLRTISDASQQDCVLRRAVGVASSPATPVSATMIAKYCDYTLKNALANFLSDRSSLTAPILNDPANYERIQNITMNVVSRFANTNGRLYGIRNTFPAFEAARVSTTEIVAASAWSAKYKDDIDSIALSGGIAAE